jgi:hypothetical protein
VKFGSSRDVFYICSSLAKLPNSEGSSPVNLFKLMPLKEKVNSTYCDTYICNVICRKEAVEYIEMNAELQTHQLSLHISLPAAGLASCVEEQEAENEKMWRRLLTPEKKLSTTLISSVRRAGRSEAAIMVLKAELAHARGCSTCACSWWPTEQGTRGGGAEWRSGSMLPCSLSGWRDAPADPYMWRP